MGSSKSLDIMSCCIILNFTKNLILVDCVRARSDLSIRSNDTGTIRIVFHHCFNGRRVIKEQGAYDYKLRLVKKSDATFSDIIGFVRRHI